MDPMARTYGTLGPSENYLNWVSGRPIAEILEEERRITHRTSPANDNGVADFSICRDQTSGALDDWHAGKATPDRNGFPPRMRLV